MTVPEPKILTTHDAWQVRVKQTDYGLAIIADDEETTDACICLDRANAALLRDELTRLLER